jgi:hypothetical protein
VPVAIVEGEHDEFIKLEHAEYLALSIPGQNSFYFLASAISHHCKDRIQQRDARFLAQASFVKEQRSASCQVRSGSTAAILHLQGSVSFTPET